jgi:hypothetical protein
MDFMLIINQEKQQLGLRAYNSERANFEMT